MPDVAAELNAIHALAALTGMNLTNVRDAKSAFGPHRTGDRRRLRFRWANDRRPADHFFTAMRVSLPVHAGLPFGQRMVQF